MDEKAASSFLNTTCQRNLTPLHGKQIVILGRKKIINMCQNAFVYKEFELEFPANEMFCKKM